MTVWNIFGCIGILDYDISFDTMNSEKYYNVLYNDVVPVIILHIEETKAKKNKYIC